MKIEEMLLEDLKAVLKEAKAMGCTEVRRFEHIQLEKLEVIVNALEKQVGKDTNVTSKNDGWISVEDRLPPEPQIGVDGYIVQKKNICEPFSAYWDGYKWTDDYDEMQDGIIAWMPLPNKYISED